MDPFLHGGLGLDNDGGFVRFYLNVDGKVWTCQISRDALNRLAGADAAGDALFDQFMDHEDDIVDRAAKAIADGAASEPIVIGDVP